MSSFLKRCKESLFHVYELRDLTPWNHERDNLPPIYGVYHVYCAKGWQELVSNQISALRHSGLLDVTERLCVSIITSEDRDVEQLKAIVDSPKLDIVSITDDVQRYEYPALEHVRFLAEHNQDSLIYYFHTKGISYQSLQTDDASFCSFQRKINAWREMLEYFMFDCWRVAVNVLLDGYDTYGSYRWPPKAYTMYSGNFWWIKADYARTLPPFSETVIRNDRFYSEVWLYELPHRDFSAFDTIADLYFVCITPTIYKQPSPPLHDYLRFVLTYNWRKLLKHVFHVNYKKRNQLRFQRLKSNQIP